MTKQFLINRYFFINMCWYKVSLTCNDGNTHRKIIPFGPDSCQSNDGESEKKKKKQAKEMSFP